MMYVFEFILLLGSLPSDMTGGVAVKPTEDRPKKKITCL